MLTGIPSLSLLANPGHGNGPTVGLLLAAEACARVSGRAVNLVFPDLSALDRGRQRLVIRNRRDPYLPLRVFFDRRLGDLLAEVTLQNNDFAGNVATIAARQPALQAAAQAHVARGLDGLTELRSDGAEVATDMQFPADELSFELSHGSRLRFLDEPRAFAFFPCLLSDLLRYEVSEGRLRNGGRDFNRQALAHIEALEAGYRAIFLPAVHTFSWDAGWRAAPNVRFIPFPRPAVPGADLRGRRNLRLLPDREGLPAGPGIYLMPSGVGSAGDAFIVQAAADLLAQADEPLAVYMPPADRPPEAFSAAFPNAVQLPAQAIAHPAVAAVIGRAGWGTLWECMNAGKAFVAIPALPGDDSEIAHNLRTLSVTGLALTWEPGSAAGLWSRAADVARNITRTLAGFAAEYGTVDGLAVMAREILETFCAVAPRDI